MKYVDTYLLCYHGSEVSLSFVGLGQQELEGLAILSCQHQIGSLCNEGLSLK